MQSEYILISDRLVREILDRAATDGPKIKGGQVGIPAAKVDIGGTNAAENIHLLATRVEDLLYDETGTVEDPGAYVGVRSHFNAWMFSFAEGASSPVAWLSTTYADNLVVLCGSARNVLGYEVPRQYPGWRPSTLGGLKEVVAALRMRDPEKLIQYRASKSAQNEIAGDVADINAGLDREGPPDFSGEFDALLKPFVCVDNFAERDINNGLLRFNRILVGAPLWVRRVSELPPPGSK